MKIQRNKITIIFYGNFMLFFIFATLLSCEDEKQESYNIKVPNEIKIKPSVEATYPEVQCDNNANFNCQTPCYCGIGSPANCCNIGTLNPCEDTSGYQYAYHFACNINKLIHCFPQQVNQNCTLRGKKCFDFGDGAVPDVLTDLIAGSDPFEYCSQANCSTFVCTDGITPVRHFPMSLTYQNAIVTYILGLRSGLTSNLTCGENETKVIITEVKACKLIGENCDEGNKSTQCSDIHIIVSYTVYCCSNPTE